MIHPAFIKSEVAFRYYMKRYPDRGYSKDEARKQFAQDTGIDRKLLREVIDEIYREQKQALKAL